MKTAIRLDDITIDMDWDRFRRIEKILDKAEIRPLVGVVPACKDPKLNRLSDSESWSVEVRDSVPQDIASFTAFLQAIRKKGWVIAVHGYEHLYRTKCGGIFPLNGYSEFAGCPYEDQLGRLSLAMKVMQELNIDTDIFMAPAHSFDGNTLTALYEVGIRSITDGFGSFPYRRRVKYHDPGDSGTKSGFIDFYPIAVKRSDCISDKTGYTTMVLHTNTMTDEDIESFDRMIRDHRDHFIDYMEYMRIPVSDRTRIAGILEYLTCVTKRVLVRLRGIIK